MTYHDITLKRLIALTRDINSTLLPNNTILDNNFGFLR